MLKKQIKLFIGLMLMSVIIVFIAACDKKINENYVTIVDMLGEEEQIKKNPTKVACVSRTTYDLLVAFGLGEYIDGAYYSLLNNSWTDVFDNDASKKYKYRYNESYETFISRGVDLVFSPEKYIKDNLKKRGITALNISLYGKPNFENYVFFFADLITQIWDFEAVKKKVNSWKEKMTNIITNIKTTLDKNPPSYKQLVYYVRGDKNNGIGYTDNGCSFIEYAYSILGCEYLGRQFEKNKPSKEAILSKNPDVIVIGGIYQKVLLNELTTNEPYINLKAVKENRVFNIPIGLTMFEQISVFSPAFLADQANKVYPDKFNFDVKKLIREIALEYFKVNLQEQEISYMLEGLNRNGKPLV